MVKTITVTNDAYESLKAMKRSDESFSEAIRRISGSARGLPSGTFGCWSGKKETARELYAEVKKRRVADDVATKAKRT